MDIRWTGGWALALSCLAATVVAVVQPTAWAQDDATTDESAPGAQGGGPAQGGGAARGGGEPSSEEREGDAAPVENTAAMPAGGYTTGLSMLPGDAEVPLAWMPPGTQYSPVPSEAIFPPQTITIRFNHEKHVKELQQTCKVCHAAAYKSELSSDRLLPDPTLTCDSCHDVDHQNLEKVVAGTDTNGQCTFCHLGEDAGVDNRVARTVIPKPNLRFTHKKHLDRNIDCAHCHGRIDKIQLATRDNLPRMAGCFRCHNMPTPARGEARGDCKNCHLTTPSGQLVTDFGSSPLQPPDWLHAAGHTPDWIDRHKSVAANDSQFCGSCHQSNFCTDCHDGRVRPRKVHPNDWMSMHAQAGRQDNPRCVSCHQLQTFCADCHRRVGVARDTASGNRLTGRRFHPPAAEWTTGPRSPGHHAWEAQRNLNACVSCHTERDCATCHASKGLRGGQGVNPHPVGFIDKCASALKRNPRPCLVCHQGADPVLRQCQ